VFAIAIAVAMQTDPTMLANQSKEQEQG